MQVSRNIFGGKRSESSKPGKKSVEGSSTKAINIKVENGFIKL